MTTAERPMPASLPLSRAATLPARFYQDPDIFEREKDRIFSRTWQLVCRYDELQRIGDFVPVTVLDEPVVITHAQDDQLHAYYNVCRHRAGQVALSKGNRKSLQCRYHGWTYGLDGCLRAAPEMEATENFRKEDFGLIAVRVDRWGPFVFVNLDDDAPPLLDVMGSIPSEVAAAGYDVDLMRPVERREYLIDCNWKVYVDNYLEGYHLPIAHPQLFKELDYDSYRIEEHRFYSKQFAPIRELKPGEELGRDRRYLRTPDGEEDALYYWCFPNTMFNIYQDNMSSNVIIPLGPDKTLTVFEWFFAEPGSGEGWESMQQTIAFSDEIQQEDIVICEQVQRGLRSRAYNTGRFSAKRENGVYHFQNLVREFLGEAG
jgi:choline monooxygenase